MSLATRCTSCGTVFRVVQDQLKVSEGWVRCGRCDEVFNALEGLFDLDRDPPPEWTAPPAPTEFRVVADEPPQEDAPDPSLVDRIDEQIFGTRRSAFGALTGLGTPERRRPDFADARFDTDLPDSDTDGPALVIPTSGSEAGSEESAAPEFIRAAEQQERWQSSRARKLMALSVVLLTLCLAGQAAHHYRDTLAARFPATQAALGTWCGLAGCTIEPPRRIEDISVESTALARAPSADAFRLSVVLRNRATTQAAMPWIDLSLTDANGQLVARRALSPQDFRARSAVLAAGGETALQALLSTGAERVVGYTVEVFYP